MLTFVLPLKLTASGNELEYMQLLQLPSLRRFAVGAVDYIVVVPDEQLDAARGCIGNVPGLRILTESEVIPGIRCVGSVGSVGCVGWYRQQIIKLAAARFVTTREYVTMDADVFLREPVALEDLYAGGGKLKLNRNAVGIHSEWWEDSARLLGVPPPPLDEVAMDVTPEVLITEEVLGLMKHLETEHRQQRFDVVLSRNRFTEYTLYWLYLRMRGAQWDLYARDGPRLFDATWYVPATSDAKAVFAKMLGTSTAPFCLFQSNQRIPPHAFF